FDNLAAAGGGLVLGTDHNVFATGINSLNSLIGVGAFSGIWFEPPYKAVVDPASPLMSYPAVAYETGSAIGDPAFYVTDNS
ncbi:MAG TPA: hypothetical protein VHG88_07125, partial [Burkholderiales bacterium]|nr:hypothetical protein [Burkholderiales bacterium]